MDALRDDDPRTWIGDPIPPRTEQESALDDVISRALRMDDAEIEHVTDTILARWRLVPVDDRFADCGHERRPGTWGHNGECLTCWAVRSTVTDWEEAR